jgi:hypothetical protein
VRAEVSADDVSLTCSYASPFISYLDHLLIDMSDTIASQSDGREEQLDPGEICGLIVYVRNYGATAADAQFELSTSDPYVAVRQSTADIGGVPSGGVADNLKSPFVVEAYSYAPRGRMADMTLTVAHGGTVTVSHFPLCVGPRHFLVWDPTPDATSGPVIYRTLRGLGFSGKYATTLTAGALADCQSLWASLGITPNNCLVSAESDEAQAIVAFLERGTSAYLEGGDIWFHDPAIGGYDFGPLFGLMSYSDGGGSMYQVVGEPGTFTEGMLMSHHGETTSIDRLTPAGTGYRLMRNNAPSYYVMIANDAGSYRTVGSSIEFDAMRDGSYPSTKATLADRIMFFFLQRDPQGVDPAGMSARTLRLILAPNPCTPGTLLNCRIPGHGAAALDLYDASGRRLRTLLPGPLAPGEYHLRLDAGTLAPGCYFVGTPDGGPRGGSKLLVLH